MTPFEFLESFVQGNLADCQENPGSVRRAFNAAVSASQLADHWYTYSKRHNPHLVASFKDLGSYVEHLCQETSGAFREVRSVANAYKHLYTDVSSKFGGYSSVDSTGAIEAVMQLDESNLEMVSEDYQATPSVVVVTRRDGSKLEFLPALEKVVEYWWANIQNSA
ncbi:hypothetical protein OS187_11240 [Xanthomonadaceae bacterium JHOS43]|nr:hypothetical protein [Xanthomonadaceae bacterium JHOS43]